MLAPHRKASAASAAEGASVTTTSGGRSTSSSRGARAGASEPPSARQTARSHAASARAARQAAGVSTQRQVASGSTPQARSAAPRPVDQSCEPPMSKRWVTRSLDVSVGAGRIIVDHARMTTEPPGEVTRLLASWRDGDPAALDRLLALVEHELRRRARWHLRRERARHTLQTTALVNEAYLRLVRQEEVSWQNRAHFFAIASQAMRRILVDHAKGNRRLKRGGGAPVVSLEDVAVIAPERSAELLALDAALEKLQRLDPRKARMVEMRYFAGLSVEEAAEVLAVSPATVMRDWRLAKAWLQREIAPATPSWPQIRPASPQTLAPPQSTYNANRLAVRNQQPSQT